MNDALRIRLQRERLRTLLADMDAEFGPVPEEEMENARDPWPDPPATRKRRPRRAAGSRTRAR